MPSSIRYNLVLDLKRGLRDRRFWTVLAVVSVIFILCLALDWILPYTQYYYGGEESFKFFPSGGHVALYEVPKIMGMQVFSAFFPFIGTAAFAFVIMDDRRQNYCMQQIQKTGFSGYYWSKLAVSGILGGLLGALCIVAACVLSLLLVDYLPVFREAVDYNVELYTRYSSGSESIRESIGWGSYKKYISLADHLWVWYLVLGSVKHFLLGVLFGLFAGIIAFFTENKVVLYSDPVISFLMWDSWVYILTRFFETDSYIWTILNKFYIRTHRMDLGDLYQYSLLAFLILVLIILAGGLRNRAECRYMEGGIRNG